MRASSQAPDGQGAPVTFLIRIESALSSPADLESFLAHCLGSLGAQYNQGVLFHVLGASGSRPGINLETAAVTRVCGLETLRIYYSRFGLQHAGAEHYLDSPLPPAWALCTWMSPVRFEPEALLAAARERIAAAGLAKERRDLLLAVAEAGAGR